MTDHPPSTAILLINLGGPDSLDSVRPFLYNLFSDPDIMGHNRLLLKVMARFISWKRSPQVRKYYSLIGGKSPILGFTLQQAEALQKSLSSYGNFSVFVAMRYWHPMIEDIVKEMVVTRFDNVVILPLYPQYSITTTGSSLNEFNRVWRRIGAPEVRINIVKEWHDNPLYIDAVCDSIQKTLESHMLTPRNAQIVFSAHGIPLRFIEQGDPYARYIERTVELVSARLGPGGNYHLCYQSRVGPLKWLGPSTEEVLKDLGGRGVKDVVLVPVSFVSDHLETLYEMDILYKEKALEYGIPTFYRVPGLNNSPLLIEALKEIVLKGIRG